MEISRKIRSTFLIFLLLFSALLATTSQGVRGEANDGEPLESQCRPYIEEALKKLETGDTPIESQEFLDESKANAGDESLETKQIDETDTRRKLGGNLEDQESTENTTSAEQVDEEKQNKSEETQDEQNEDTEQEGLEKDEDDDKELSEEENQDLDELEDDVSIPEEPNQTESEIETNDDVQREDEESDEDKETPDCEGETCDTASNQVSTEDVDTTIDSEDEVSAEQEASTEQVEESRDKNSEETVIGENNLENNIENQQNTENNNEVKDNSVEVVDEADQSVETAAHSDEAIDNASLGEETENIKSEETVYVDLVSIEDDNVPDTSTEQADESSTEQDEQGESQEQIKDESAEQAQYISAEEVHAAAVEEVQEAYTKKVQYDSTEEIEDAPMEQISDISGEQNQDVSAEMSEEAQNDAPTSQTLANISAEETQVDLSDEGEQDDASAEKAQSYGSVEEVPGDAFAEEAQIDTSAEEAVFETSVEQVRAESSAEDAQVDTSAEEKQTETSGEQEGVNVSTEKNKESLEQHEDSISVEAGQDKDEDPTENTQDDESTKQIALGQSAEQQDEDSPEKKDKSVEQQMGVLFAEDNASDDSAEKVPVGASTEKAYKVTSNNQGEGEASAEQINPDESAEKNQQDASIEEVGDGSVGQVENEVESQEAKIEEISSETEQVNSTEVQSTPEEDLMQSFDIPTNLRPRDHISQLMHLDDDSNEVEKVINKAADVILKDLKRIYENAIKPLETLYKYRDLSNRHFGDPEILSKPLVLFMGPWSGGKSSIINYLLDNEYNTTSLRTGAEPSPAYFNILMWGEESEMLDGTQLAADWTFSGLQKFGQGLEERLKGLKLPSKLLEKINIVEIPGILEVRKQVSRVFPFNDACQWFIDRADIIFLVYDPSKLDVGPETEAILDQLKGREYQTRIILNKADQVKSEELMRVQGALIWNLSPLMSSAQPPIMYLTSLWSRPYEDGAPIRLLQAQERSFLRDIRTAFDKRIENKIASARRFAVRVRNHAKMVDCYLTTYYNHKSVFANKKLVSDQIIDHPQEYHIYEGLSTLTNISRYDLPDPDVYRDFFHLNPLYEFQQLSATCTYFRGCPINRLDVAIAYDFPELVGKYKKLVETALANVPNSTGNS